MKILEFRAENVKKLSIVQQKLDPKKGLVIVSGKNGQGKSSVLDSIEMILRGGDAIPGEPIRRGQLKGEAEIDLGEYRARRTFTKGGGTLTVWNKDAMKQASPQTLLDSLFNKHTFDPVAFAGMKPADQASTLQRLLSLDFSTIDQQKEDTFTERTLINRELKNEEGHIRLNPRNEGVPEKEIDTAEIAAQQQKAVEQIKAHGEARTELEKAKQVAARAALSVSDCEDRIIDMEKRVKELQDKVVMERATLKNLNEALEHSATVLHKTQEAEKAFGTDPDMFGFGAQLNQIAATNKKIAANRDLDVHITKLNDLRRKSEKLSDKLSALDAKKRDMMAAAKFPVEGLGFDNSNMVTFGGLPLDQACTSDKIRISVAIGLALNPKLKVLLIRQGNDLDDDNLALVGKLAEEADAQIWLERVNTEGDVSLILEDGHIKGHPPIEDEPAPATEQTNETNKGKAQDQLL